MGFMADPGCRRDFVTRFEVAICAGAVFIELAAARLGEDTRIAVSQHDTEPWTSPLALGVPLLIEQEPVLQAWLAICCTWAFTVRVHLDMPLQQVPFGEVGMAAFKFVEERCPRRRTPRWPSTLCCATVSMGAGWPLWPGPAK